MDLAQLGAAPGMNVRRQRPVFQDLSLRRWYGFLALVGSAGATAAFLTAILWYSVQVTPDLPLLQPEPPAPASIAPLRAEPLAAAAAQAVPPREQHPPERRLEPSVLPPVPRADGAGALASQPRDQKAWEPRGGESPVPGAPSDDALFGSASFAVLGAGISPDTVVYLGAWAKAGGSGPTP